MFVKHLINLDKHTDIVGDKIGGRPIARKEDGEARSQDYEYDHSHANICAVRHQPGCVVEGFSVHILLFASTDETDVRPKNRGPEMSINAC